MFCEAPFVRAQYEVRFWRGGVNNGRVGRRGRSVRWRRPKWNTQKERNEEYSKVAIKVGSKVGPKDAVRGALEELEKESREKEEKKSADRTG